MQHGHVQAVFYIFIFFYLNTYLIFYLFIFNSLDLIHWINHARNKYMNQQGSSAMIMLPHKNNTRYIDTVLWLHEFITHQTSTVRFFFFLVLYLVALAFFVTTQFQPLEFCYLISWKCLSISTNNSILCNTATIDFFVCLFLILKWPFRAPNVTGRA